MNQAPASVTETQNPSQSTADQSAPITGASASQPFPTQDKFLDELMARKVEVYVYLVNGIKLSGMLTGHEKFSLFLRGGNGQVQMVYKHAISTVLPANGQTQQRR